MGEAKRRKRVLILCTGNSCRSQMAEGLWRRLAGNDWDVFSAGSKPAGHVHPLAVAVMNEIGIDISTQKSKHVDSFGGQAFEVVLTVCGGARETCPIFSAAGSLLHWPFEDPASAQGSPETQTSVFRRVRDEIRQRIEQHLNQSREFGRE